MSKNISYLSSYFHRLNKRAEIVIKQKQEKAKKQKIRQEYNKLYYTKEKKELAKEYKKLNDVTRVPSGFYKQTVNEINNILRQSYENQQVLQLDDILHFININGKTGAVFQIKTNRQIITHVYDDNKHTRDVLLSSENSDGHDIFLGIKVTYKNKIKHFGAMFDGSMNCVIKAVLDLGIISEKYAKKLEKDYNLSNKKGMEEFLLEKLSKDIHKVIYVISHNKEPIKFGKSKNGSITIYNRNNHCTITEQEKKDKEVIYMEFYELDTLFDTLDIKIIVDIFAPLEQISSIKTLDKEYRLKYDRNIDLEETKCFTATQYYTQQLIKNNPEMQSINSNHENIETIKQFSNNLIYYQEESTKNNTCLDLLEAFNNYMNHDEYTGLPSDLNTCITVENLTFEQQYDIINNNEGIAEVEYYNILTKHTIISLLSFPEIRQLIKNNIPGKINYMMISSKRIHLNVDLFKNLEKRELQKVFGTMDKKYQSKSFCTTDIDVSNHHGGFQFRNTNLFICTEKVKHIGRSYHPHIVGYIHAYCNIQIMKQVLCLQSLGHTITRVWVDGIDSKQIDYYYEDKVEELATLWHIKESKDIPKQIIKEESKDISYPKKISNTYNTLLKNVTKHCHLTGGPGYGKSWNLKQLYNQTPNSIILVPTNKLKREYNGYNCITIDSYLANIWGIDIRYSTIFIDEYTLCSQVNFDKLVKLSPTSNIILVGDMDQIKIIKKYGEPIDTSNMTTKILTKNYRQLDIGFDLKIKEVKNTADIDWIKFIKLENIDIDNSIILSSTHEEIKRINNFFLKKNNNPLIHGWKVNTPIRFLEKDKNYYISDIGTIIDITKTSLVIKSNEIEELIYIDIKKARKILIEAYSLTYHCMQGQNIKEKDIIINPKISYLFDKNRMFYVAVSRVCNESQLRRLI